MLSILSVTFVLEQESPRTRGRIHDLMVTSCLLYLPPLVWLIGSAFAEAV